MIGKQGGKQTITSAAYVFLVVILGILGYGAAFGVLIFEDRFIH